MPWLKQSSDKVPLPDPSLIMSKFLAWTPEEYQDYIYDDNRKFMWDKHKKNVLELHHGHVVKSYPIKDILKKLGESS